jgi:hypothetical protein
VPKKSVRRRIAITSIRSIRNGAGTYKILPIFKGSSGQSDLSWGELGHKVFECGCLSLGDGKYASGDDDYFDRQQSSEFTDLDYDPG